jgi:hypothetical protein
MKTSNIIFLSFLIFLFGGITLLYIGSKYHEGNKDFDANMVTQAKTLPSFSVIVVESGSGVHLVNGKENKIIQTHWKDSVSKFAPFVVRNDTLFIAAMKRVQNKDNTHYIDAEVFCVTLKSIVAKEKSYVGISKFEIDSLNISMNKSKLNWDFGKVAFVSIQAKDSDIDFQGEKLGKVVVKLDKTRLNTTIQERADALCGSLINASDIRFSMTNNVNLNGDDTSNYDFYNYSN